MNALGVILAGGQSSRMGTDKALVEVAGSPMVEWVANALREVCKEIVVVGRGEEVAGLPNRADRPGPGGGPLAGIVTALEIGGSCLVVAVDQPWVRRETLRGILELGGTAVPVAAGVRQVTCALYDRSVLEAGIAELEGGGSVQSLLDRVGHREVTEREWQRFGEDGRSWWSADTPEALAEGLARFGPPAGWGNPVL